MGKPDGRSLADRVWAKVARSSGCWLWTGATNATGYGVVYAEWLREEGRPRMLLAHRAVWMLLKGEIPADRELCHTCNNPPCVNPEHLYVGTHAQNMADAGRAGVMARDNRGDRNPARRLTATQVMEIRSTYRPGPGAIPELAQRFGVHVSTIGLVVRGRTWKEVA